MGTVVSTAALATFPVPLRPTVVPRHTVYRFVVPADCDLSDVLDRLTRRDLEVLEIRRCHVGSPPGPRDGPGRSGGGGADRPPVEAGRSSEDSGVVVPFARGGTRPSAAGS